MAEQNPPFIRNLASSDLKLRTASLTSLRTFLAPRSLTRTEALKLWTGIFYALWMSDRPLPQQSLAAALADLQLTSVRASSAGVWMGAFWEVVASRWTGIDVLRMEKFLLLVRRVVCAGMRWVMEGASVEGKKKGGEQQVEERAKVLIDVLGEWPFGRNDVPLGLRLHVVDIWVDELERAGALESEDPAVKKLVVDVGEVVRGVTKDVPSKPLREKAAESLNDERLPWYETPEEEEGEAGWEGFGD